MHHGPELAGLDSFDRWGDLVPLRDARGMRAGAVRGYGRVAHGFRGGHYLTDPGQETAPASPGREVLKACTSLAASGLQMRVASVLPILFLGTLLAGCVVSEGAPGAPEEDRTAPLGPNDISDSESGVVQGTILTEETLPIVGALVALQNSAFSTTTDSAGFFQLANVSPGKYVLLVGALGYDSAARQIEIMKAQITSASLVLRAIEVQSATFVEILHFVGFFECALATDPWISSCSYPYTAAWGTLNGTGLNPGLPRDIQNNQHRFNFTIRPNVGQLQAEVVWQPASAAATRMMILILCGDYDYVWDECLDGIRYRNAEDERADVRGTSPIKFTVNREEFYTENAKGTKYDLEKYPEVWIMNYIGLPWGEADTPGDEQLAFQQKFEVWDSVFYNGEGPVDWTVLADG